MIYIKNLFYAVLERRFMQDWVDCNQFFK